MRPRGEADHSPQSSSDVKEWAELYLHYPNTPSWRGAQLGGAQGYEPPNLRNENVDLNRIGFPIRYCTIKCTRKLIFV